MSISLLMGIAEQGLFFGIMVLGVYLTFRVLDYADLTVDGSFTLGAAVAASAITAGVNPLAATALAFAAGLAAGTVTGILHTKFRITALLSGILTMIGLYSVNLRIMGRPNISLLREDTLITFLEGIVPGKGSAAVFLGVITAGFTVLALYLFLNTEAGLALRATGDNERMISSFGVNTGNAKIMGLALSNGLVALSGAEIAQYSKFADANMGIGMIVTGLASVIIGEVIFGTGGLLRTLLAVVGGSLIYRFVIGLVLSLGLPATDLKLMTAVIVVAALASPKLKKRFRLSF